MGLSAIEKLRALKQALPQKVDFEGELEKIISLGFDEKKGMLVPILSFKIKDKEINFSYEGIILPDSIGHKVKVHYNKDKEDKIQVHDLELDRWYR